MRTHFLPVSALSVLLLGSSVIGAFAADLPSRKAPLPPAPQVGLDRTATGALQIGYEPYSWTGFYIGGFAGGALNTNKLRVDGSTGYASAAESLALKPHALSLGGLAGYNYSFNQFVVGGEADVSYTMAKKSAAFAIDSTSVGTADTKSLYVGRLRARAGYAILPQLLLFGAAGGSITNEKIALTSSNPAVTSVSISNPRYGWNIGAGVEYALTEHILARVDYIHDQYIDKTSNFLSKSVWADRSLSLQSDTARAGVSYKF